MRSLGAVPFLVVLALASSVAVSPATERRKVPVQLEEKGLAIYGTVMRPGTREPVAGASIRLTQTPFPFARRSETVGLSNAEGRFSFQDLDAGTYYLFAGLPDDPETPEQPFRSVDLVTGRPSPDVALWIAQRVKVSGNVRDSEGGPVVGARVDLWRSSWINGRQTVSATVPPRPVRTDQAGHYAFVAHPGEYLLAVGAVSDSSSGPVYYPGVVYPEDALPVVVRAGVDLAGIDVVRPRVQQFAVRFEYSVPEYLPGAPEPLTSYLDEGGLPIQTWLLPHNRGSISSPGYAVEIQPGANGTWSTPPLPVGDYDLFVVYNPRLNNALPEVDWFRLDPIAVIPITLADEDVDLGRLKEASRGSVSGRVRVQDDFDTTSIRFGLISLNSGIPRETIYATPDASGAFLFEAVYPSLFLLTLVDPLPEGWFLESVTSGGRNVLVDGLLVGDGVHSPIDVVIANGLGQLEGVIRNSADELVPDARVILVPSAARRGPLTQFPTAVANSSGVYRLESVPPGEYRMLALDLAGTRNPNWESPDFLRQYELQGERITVDPSGRMTVNLEAIPYAP